MEMDPATEILINHLFKNEIEESYQCIRCQNINVMSFPFYVILLTIPNHFNHNMNI